MSAVISPCGRYRYLLSRAIGDGGILGPRCVFIMLNPSTAGAETDDPTIRRCLGYARDWGYAHLDVINLFAYRATDPRVIRGLNRGDACGPQNAEYFMKTIAGVGHNRPKIICAWGNHGLIHDEGPSTLRFMRGLAYHIHALKLNDKTGQPAHPLYLKADLKPFPI